MPDVLDGVFDVVSMNFVVVSLICVALFLRDVYLRYRVG
jgi:hypothetical protein